MADAFAQSIESSESREIDDRIAYILVRDGISREELKRAIYIDRDKPYYEQTMSPSVLMLQTANFLGVSVEWLLTGKGRNTREPERMHFERSAVVSGNHARTINVNNYN